MNSASQESVPSKPRRQFTASEKLRLARRTACYARTMATPSTSELLKLDVQTRLQIIDELWDSVVSDLNDPEQASSLPVPEEMRALLDERMREYHADPSIGRPWAEVHERLLKMT